MKWPLDAIFQQVAHKGPASVRIYMRSDFRSPVHSRTLPHAPPRSRTLPYAPARSRTLPHARTRSRTLAYRVALSGRSEAPARSCTLPHSPARSSPFLHAPTHPDTAAPSRTLLHASTFSHALVGSRALPHALQDDVSQEITQVCPGRGFQKLCISQSISLKLSLLGFVGIVILTVFNHYYGERPSLAVPSSLDSWAY